MVGKSKDPGCRLTMAFCVLRFSYQHAQKTKTSVFQQNRIKSQDLLELALLIRVIFVMRTVGPYILLDHTPGTI